MPQHLTREQFRRWAEAQAGRYERVGGEPVAMTPERVQHVRLKNRVWAALDRAIRAAGLECEALGDGITIEVDANTDYEPDAMMNCGPPMPPDSMAASNPVVVVEVLSPATQAIDTTDKLADYFRVPSVKHALVVRTRRHEIVHHDRAGDGLASRVVNIGCIRLEPPGITIDLADIYAGP